MTNLTVTIDDELLKRARIRALEQDTSVNALVREYLEGLAGQAKTQDAIRSFLELAERSNAGSGSEGREWTRDELYER
jgi:plasmid stability protein